MYWISAPETMARELKGLGVALGPRVGESWEGCTVTDEAMKSLDSLWGAIFWGPEGETRRPILDQLLRRINGEPEPQPIKRKPARRKI